MNEADYRNWMPKGMIWSFASGTAVSLALMLIIGLGWLKIALMALTVILALVTVWTVMMYLAFSYNGKRQMSRQIIDGMAECIKLQEGGTFAIHDIFSRQKYGDMQAFVERLKDLGYEQVELIPTDNGRFMSKREALWLG